MNLEECIKIVECKYESAVVYKNTTGIIASDIHKYQSNAFDVVVFCSHSITDVDLPNKTYHDNGIMYYFNIDPLVLDDLTMYLMGNVILESGIEL